MLARARAWLNADAKRDAHASYIALIAQARNSFFYSGLRVPDTLDGRFEVILLHLFLVLERLKREPGKRYLEPARRLTEAYFADMDRSLRELGVGDTGVSRRVKAMANACYGRMEAYEVALRDPAALREALRRNVYATASEPVDEAALERLAAYLAAAHDALGMQTAEDVAKGRVTFPSPE